MKNIVCFLLLLFACIHAKAQCPNKKRTNPQLFCETKKLTVEHQTFKIQKATVEYGFESNKGLKIMYNNDTIPVVSVCIDPKLNIYMDVSYFSVDTIYFKGSHSNFFVQGIIKEVEVVSKNGQDSAVSKQTHLTLHFLKEKGKWIMKKV